MQYMKLSSLLIAVHTRFKDENYMVILHFVMRLNVVIPRMEWVVPPCLPWARCCVGKVPNKHRWSHNSTSKNIMMMLKTTLTRPRSTCLTWMTPVLRRSHRKPHLSTIYLQRHMLRIVRHHHPDVTTEQGALWLQPQLQQLQAQWHKYNQPLLATLLFRMRRPNNVQWVLINFWGFWHRHLEPGMWRHFLNGSLSM